MTITKNFLCRNCGGYGKNHRPGCPHYRPPAKPCRHCKVRGGNRGRRLCHACRSDPAVLALYPLAGKLPPCRHCDRRAANKPPGLCSVCHGNPRVLALYQPGPGNPHPAASQLPPLPVRQPGESVWRCLYCSEFRCDGPLRRCGECDKDFARRAEGMPGA